MPVPKSSLLNIHPAGLTKAQTFMSDMEIIRENDDQSLNSSLDSFPSDNGKLSPIFTKSSPSKR